MTSAVEQHPSRSPRGTAGHPSCALLTPPQRPGSWMGRPSWSPQAGRWDGIWNKDPAPKLEILCKLTFPAPHPPPRCVQGSISSRNDSCHIAQELNASDTWVARADWRLFPAPTALPQPCSGRVGVWTVGCGRWSVFIAFGKQKVPFNEPT